jgi:hypothetical protein
MISRYIEKDLQFSSGMSQAGCVTNKQLLKKKAAKEDIQYDDQNEVQSVLEQALAVMPPDIKDYDVSTSGKLQGSIVCLS